MTCDKLALVRERRNRGDRAGAFAYGVVAVALIVSATIEASRSVHLATTHDLRVSELLSILALGKSAMPMRAFSGPEVAFLLSVGTAVVQGLLLGLVAVVALGARAGVRYQRRLWARIDELERADSARACESRGVGVSK